MPTIEYDERKLREQLRADLEDLRHWHNPYDAQKENAWLHKEFRKSREALSLKTLKKRKDVNYE